MEQPNIPTGDTKEMPQEKRGGARIGAGRKKTTEKRYGLRAPADVVEIIEAAENKTDFICEAVRFYHAHLLRNQKNS